MGLMQAMLTQSHNDRCPEMAATVRRGPLAKPNDEEMIEYLLTRRRREQDAVKVGHHSLEHVLSYQRRIQVTGRHSQTILLLRLFIFIVSISPLCLQISQNKSLEIAQLLFRCNLDYRTPGARSPPYLMKPYLLTKTTLNTNKNIKQITEQVGLAPI